MLGISRAVVTGLVAAGFVTPARGDRNEYRFSFQDVVLLRTAYDLRAAKIPPRKILRSLQRLKTALPRELPLTGLRITAIGNDIAVRDGSRQWTAESGQLLMDFEVSPARGTVAILQRKPGPGGSGAGFDAGSAGEWFAHGEQLEETDAKAAAEAAYRRAVALAPGYADAWLNLGAMLCEADRCAEAAALYDEAGLQGCSSHSGRRTFITNAAKLVAKAGGSLRDVQELAGHRALTTTERYIEGDRDAQRKLVRLL